FLQEGSQRPTIVNQVRECLLLKRIVKGLEGLRQNPFQAARWCQTTAVGAGREALNQGTLVLGQSNERAQTDSAWITAQPHAASSPSARLQVTRVNQTINDLGQVILRQLIFCRDFANGKGLVSLDGRKHQDTKRVIGKAGEHHTAAKHIARAARW